MQRSNPFATAIMATVFALVITLVVVRVAPWRPRKSRYQRALDTVSEKVTRVIEKATP